MGKFRRLPIEIDAVQYLGNGNVASKGGPPDWMWEGFENGTLSAGPDGSILIKTPEGVIKAVAKDWVIRGIRGELYPCKPDIFDANYEVVK